MTIEQPWLERVLNSWNGNQVITYAAWHAVVRLTEG
jgi:hypothetical protein